MPFSFTRVLVYDNIIEKILSLATKDVSIDVIWLYGSRAKKSALAHSDYDLAIAFSQHNISVLDKKLRPNELALDWAEILDIEHDKLSIVDINSIPVYLAFNVIEYGQVIFQRDNSRRYREANRVYSQYEFQLLEASK